MEKERETIELQRQQLLQERQQYQFEFIKNSAEFRHRLNMAASPAPSSSATVNGAETQHQSEESMDSQTSEGSTVYFARILFKSKYSLFFQPHQLQHNQETKVNKFSKIP